MKKWLASSLLSLGLTGLCFASSSDDFSFENDTGYTVTDLRVSAHDASKWGSNVLDSPVASGDSTEIYWNDEPDTDYFDFRIGFGNGTHFDFTDGWDLSKVSRVWVSYNESTGRLTLHAK